MKLLHGALLALALLATSGMALADHDHDHGHDHDRHGWNDRGDHGRGHAYGHRDDRRYYMMERRHDRGHRWERGHRYGGPIYVVRDYRYYRLRPPPRGYGWVRADNNDYLLVALTTGIILDIATH